MKSVAILQSNYIPWKGYFDIIHDVDLFIFYDDVQYTKARLAQPQPDQDRARCAVAHDPRRGDDRTA